MFDIHDANRHDQDDRAGSDGGYHRDPQPHTRDDEAKADRPAGPGAESMAVPEAGEIGPAAAPPD